MRATPLPARMTARPARGPDTPPGQLDASLDEPRVILRENGPDGEPGVRAEASRGPGAMNDPVDPDRTPTDDEPDAPFDAALRAAFGPPSTAAGWFMLATVKALRNVASRYV